MAGLITSPELERVQNEIFELKKRLTEERGKIAPQPVGDYTFRRPDGSSVTLSELFGDKSDLLLVHNMGRSCPYCTLWADGFRGVAQHVAGRAAFALSSPDEPAVLGEFAKARGWNFPVVSISGTSFAADLGFEPNPGEFWPGVSAFRRREDGGVERVSCSFFGPGDDFCAVWPFFDLLADGANGWEPA